MRIYILQIYSKCGTGMLADNTLPNYNFRLFQNLTEQKYFLISSLVLSS